MTLSLVVDNKSVEETQDNEPEKDVILDCPQCGCSEYELIERTEDRARLQCIDCRLEIATLTGITGEEI